MANDQFKGSGGKGFLLKSSAGKGGTNTPEDVLVLKRRLIDLGFDWLTPNAGMDDATIAAIKLFQAIKNGSQIVKDVDGTVDVTGKTPTYDWLRAANAPRWQLMPEGSRAQGFVNAERADTTDIHDYGTNWMAATIEGAGATYRDQYLTTHPQAALLTINDVSLPHGGDTPDHNTHEAGLACDIKLPAKDGTTPGGITHKHAIYDQEGMRAMLKALRAQPLVTRIFFNDAVLIHEGLCVSVTGHDDHAHFEIRPPQPEGV